MTQHIDLKLPISTSFGGADGEEMAGKTISATAGLPGFQLGTAAGPGISAYAAPHIKLSTGGGGTAHSDMGKTGDDHVGDTA